MRIIVASTREVKLKAVKDALMVLGARADVKGVKAPSGVNEQPVNEETQQGARARANIAQAQNYAPGADYYIAIESGIFLAKPGDHFYRGNEEAWFDKAYILVVSKDGLTHATCSEAVEFPTAMVDLARQRGFETTTVGQVMQEQGLVRDHADPHKDLVGTSRADLLKKALVSLLEGVLLVQRHNPRTDMPLTGKHHG